jgi:hypothetical protein
MSRLTQGKYAGNPAEKTLHFTKNHSRVTETLL